MTINRNRTQRIWIPPQWCYYVRVY